MIKAREKNKIKKTKKFNERLPKYNPLKIEKKWQKIWARNNYSLYHVSDFPKKKHLYILDMFPYPSGEGLHVGHVEGYTASDILTRYYRMNGYEVLHPMGWDAFGLPAENYALKTKIPPQKVVPQNIKKFKKQLESLGFAYDWQREINTTDSQYYKWTQWIFLQLFKNGLAYEDEIPVNWCPSCKTVLADEEVKEGKCERCESSVIRKRIRQWLLKITAYAERLLKDLDLIDWPERVKIMQRNWIGRSEGAEIDFKIDGLNEYLKVFTTRPETIFGATYLVLAPEHPLVLKITKDDRKEEVQRYIEKALSQSDFERLLKTKEKTGVFLGSYAINPANREKIPIWISDYVLMNYGTGAIMAVPAHDKRDFEFAKQFLLPIKEVISSNGEPKERIEEPYEGDGILINSGPFNGLSSDKAKDKIIFYVGGKKAVYYKLRDWVFSRQRYWGEPIPIIKCPKCGNVPLKEKDLPLKLPEIKKFEPTGKNESPLSDLSSWVNTFCPICHSPAKRETNTMPQWAGSCWYYLRYLDPKNKKKLVDYKKQKEWLPVNIYIGGVEHAVLHLLYARFWHKFLYDLKIVSQPEPFYKLINQGIILGEDGEKMSKSKGNVVNPDEIIKKYGADTLRMYEMFLGPLPQVKSWNTLGINGIFRFLNRVWDLIVAWRLQSKKEKPNKLNKEEKLKLKETILDLEIFRQKTIKRVTEDIEKMRFNTAISALMEYLNKLEEIPKNKLDKKYLKTLILLLSPFAPHISQELSFNYLNIKKPLIKEKWPNYEKDKVEEKKTVYAIQINGKTKKIIELLKGLSQKEAEKKVLPLIQKYLTDKKIKKVIFVQDKIINFVF